MIPAVRDHGGLVELLAVLDDDHGRHRLDPARVAQRDHGNLGYRRQAVDGFLDLAARHVLAAGLDHVLLAVHDRDVALLVHHAEIARVEPAAGEGLGRLRLVAEIAGQQLRRAMHDLAHRAARHLVAGIVDDDRLDVQHRLAGGARLADLVLGRQHGRRGRDLRLAIDVPEARTGQALLHLLQYRHRHDRSAVVALLQARQVVRLEERRAQQRDPHRGRREQRRDSVAADLRQYRFRCRRGGDDVGGAVVDAGTEEGVELRAVEQRHRVQHGVGGGIPGRRHHAHVLRDHRLVRQHCALGQRLGAAGVEDLGQHAAVQFGFRARRIGARLEQRLEGNHALAGLCGYLARQPDELLDGRSFRGRRARQLREARIGAQHARPRVTQDVGQLVGIQHEVDRHQHRAGARDRKAHRDEGMRVAREYRDLVAHADADAAQPPRHAVHDGIKSGIAPAHVAAHHRGTLRHTARAAPQQVPQRLSPGNRYTHLTPPANTTRQLSYP